MSIFASLRNNKFHLWRYSVLAGALTLLFSGFAPASSVRAGTVLSADISIRETDVRSRSREEEHLIDSLDVLQLSPSANLLSLSPAPPADLADLPVRRILPRGVWRDIVRRAAKRYDLPENLISAVIHTESGFNSRAVSPKGARGAMQIMPETQRELSLKDAWDPEANVMAGCSYLARQIARFGSLELGLAAYNAGPEAVERYGGVPPFKETQAYVKRVLALYHLAEKGASHDPQ
ncbi:lytic transglycosylase domain-containing protein [uncultured Mailhella sp.]|uniref:lytic transglycosylase domain-containing protein n=1 Tax=uncultured Mailhella sp. TaxID=1981031 RepID=UPI002636AC46|nr:lytic transglycosylase domain-containing protein [uncultured Mailhella sp.]